MVKEQEEIAGLKVPETLVGVIRYFSNPDIALAFMVSIRWPDGIKCPHCGEVKKEPIYISTRRKWKCRGCRKQFSVKVGTVMEDSPLGIDKWLTAVWLLANCKNGISSYELHRDLGITQKSAWFMLHRIRLALQAGSFEKKLCGTIEVDETYIGGKARNMHKGKKVERIKGRGPTGKAVVMGLLERKGEVRAKVIGNIKKQTLQEEVRQNVELGSKVHSDSLASYEGLSLDYIHKVVNHAETYVIGEVHTNGMENYWSLLKRAINGTYVSVEAFHLFRYLDEENFRYNNRKDDDSGRFVKAVQGVTGKRLTYQNLIGEEPKVQTRGRKKM